MIKAVLFALVVAATATSAFACGIQKPTCILGQTTVLFGDDEFCFSEGQKKAESHGIAIEDHGHSIYSVTAGGKIKFMKGYILGRCLDAPVYLREIATN